MLLGLKLWSTNNGYFESARALFDKGVFDYIELFAAIGSFDSTIDKWRDMGIPFALHAPHLYGGFHIAGAGTTDEQALDIFRDVDRFRDALSPRYIVFHAAESGTIGELTRRISLMSKQCPRLHGLALVENLPRLGLRDERCEGASPEEMRSILEATGLGLCLDFGHAIAYAAHAKRSPLDVIDEFMALKPAACHLSDGHIALPYDEHLNLGMGDYPLAEIIARVGEDVWLTLETTKRSTEKLDDFVQDAARVRAVSAADG